MVQPRVLMVITDTGRRGAQVFAKDLADAFVGAGHETRVVALAPGAGATLDVEPLGRTRRSLCTLRALRREIRSADVVVAHGSTTLPLCAALTIGTGRPLIYRQISDSRFWASTITRRLRTALLLRRATRVVSLWSGSAEVLTSYLWVRHSKIRVIPNGVPSTRFPAPTEAERATARQDLHLTPDEFVVSYLGALAPEKGVDTVIDALAFASFHLLIAGDGPTRESLEHQSNQCHPAPVTFLGPLLETWPVYAASDAVVLPSRGGDSMPAVLIEAGLAAIPVVSTPIDGIPEIVRDGETGILVRPDDPEVLARAICLLAGDVDLQRRLGRAARAHCRSHFDIEVVAQQWWDLCCEVARDP